MGFLDHPTPLAIAHRGGAAEAPENTMSAFQHAVELGYTHVETDVRATADGRAVLFHDAGLARLTRFDARVSRMEWRELARLRIYGTEPLCLLEDLLGAWPDLNVNLDPKSADAIAPLAAAVSRTGSIDRVCVTSFSWRRTAAVRRLLGPGVVVGASPIQLARIGRGLGRRRPPPFDCVQAPERIGPVVVVDEAFTGRCHSLGLPLHVWTVDDPSRVERLCDMGVDGIMTDAPTMVRDVLAERASKRAPEG